MTRVAAHPIEEQFLQRWSPRAMSGAPLAEADLWRLLEAARWAPSGGNSQPWRFVYGVAGTPAFERLFGLLVPANQAWCKRAGALFCLVSRQVLDSGRPSSSASLDAGAAWMSLALQASAMGLVVHAMGGYDAARARTELAVPADHKPECMIAVGHPGSVDDLPEDLRAREKPSDRKPIASLVFEGTFPPGPTSPTT